MSASVRSKCVGSRARLFFSVMVVAVFSALLVGCGKDDDDPPLVCANGEAWVFDGGGIYDEVSETAFIFRSNGEFLFVNKPDLGACDFCIDGNTWYIDPDETGTYSTSGNTLTIRNGESNYTSTMTYSVSGNKLTLTAGDESMSLTKKSGINPVYPKP